MGKKSKKKKGKMTNRNLAQASSLVERDKESFENAIAKMLEMKGGGPGFRATLSEKNAHWYYNDIAEAMSGWEDTLVDAGFVKHYFNKQGCIIPESIICKNIMANAPIYSIRKPEFIDNIMSYVEADMVISEIYPEAWNVLKSGDESIPENFRVHFKKPWKPHRLFPSICSIDCRTSDDREDGDSLMVSFALVLHEIVKDPFGISPDEGRGYTTGFTMRLKYNKEGTKPDYPAFCFGSPGFFGTANYMIKKIQGKKLNLVHTYTAEQYGEAAKSSLDGIYHDELRFANMVDFFTRSLPLAVIEANKRITDERKIINRYVGVSAKDNRITVKKKPTNNSSEYHVYISEGKYKKLQASNERARYERMYRGKTKAHVRRQKVLTSNVDALREKRQNKQEHFRLIERGPKYSIVEIPIKGFETCTHLPERPTAKVVNVNVTH